MNDPKPHPPGDDLEEFEDEEDEDAIPDYQLPDDLDD